MRVNARIRLRGGGHWCTRNLSNDKQLLSKINLSDLMNSFLVDHNDGLLEEKLKRRRAARYWRCVK